MWRRVPEEKRNRSLRNVGNVPSDYELVCVMDTQDAIWGLNDGECCHVGCDAVCPKRNATGPSETVVTSNQTTRCHIPEDSSLQWRCVFTARYELNSYMILGWIALFEGLSSLSKHLVKKCALPLEVYYSIPSSACSQISCEKWLFASSFPSVHLSHCSH
jgi:hypothetical protein